jgi:hypothetical protein
MAWALCLKGITRISITAILFEIWKAQKAMICGAFMQFWGNFQGL